MQVAEGAVTSHPYLHLHFLLAFEMHIRFLHSIHVKNVLIL